MEAREQLFPSGFKEVRNSEQVLALSQKKLPWLDKDFNVPLVEVTLAGDSKKFFYGSSINGNRKLVDAANYLDEARSRVVNNLFASHIPTFIREGHHPYIKMLQDRVSEKPIYVIHNKSGQRVYFMRLDELMGLPAIIRVAVCDKAQQLEVLKVLTRDQKHMKARSKL